MAHPERWWICKPIGIYWRAIALQSWCSSTPLYSHQHLEDERDRFLNDLSQFDGAICVVGDRPHFPGDRGEGLQWFAPDSQLVENIVGWIRAIVLDS